MSNRLVLVVEAGAGSGGAAVSKSCRFFKWSTALVDDVEKTYRQMSEKGIEFVAPLKKEAGAPRRSSKTPTATHSCSEARESRVRVRPPIC